MDIFKDSEARMIVSFKTIITFMQINKRSANTMTSQSTLIKVGIILLFLFPQNFEYNQNLLFGYAPFVSENRGNHTLYIVLCKVQVVHSLLLITYLLFMFLAHYIIKDGQIKHQNIHVTHTPRDVIIFSENFHCFSIVPTKEHALHE